jgi:formate hydrogenlyase subunit 3/multisubunit Na+/H+ antiporter MnhD subunit
MSTLLLLAALLTPLAGLALLALPGPARRAGLALAPWAALPALLLAIRGEAPTIEVPWLLLGVHLGLDGTRRIFLLLTAGLWTAAGVYARVYHQDDPQRLRLFAFHLATQLGNLGLVVAADVVTFYLFFVVMNFAAVGLIVHSGTPEAIRATLVYLVLVIVGEALILPGLWLAVADAPSLAFHHVAGALLDAGPLPTALLVAGFGIKAGALPLHVWLPLAHPVAPTPASAILSGAMIKAGLLAWLGLLPLGLAPLPGFALLFLVVGMTGAFYGAAIGVLQSNPKTVLAYSSISQMGLIMAAIGAALASPEAAAAGLLAALVYALHHALAKGALFLGVGVVDHAGARRRTVALALLLLPALALAGAPLTSGVVAKTALKEATYGLPEGWQGPLDLLLPLAAVGTTLLMARFLWVLAVRPAAENGKAKPGLWPPWLALLGAVAIAAWLPTLVPASVRAVALTPTAVLDALWPIALALLLAAGALWWARRGRGVPRVREGDLLWPAQALGLALWAGALRLWQPVEARLPRGLPPAVRGGAAAGSALERVERALTTWPLLLTALLALTALIAALAAG